MLCYTNAMPDDNPGQPIEQQTAEQCPSGQPTNPPSPPNDPLSTKAQSVANQEVQSEVKGIEDRVKRAELWMIWLTAAIAFSGICGVAVGFMQWHEIRAGSTDTHTLAEAAKKQANKMETMSSAANKIRQAAEDMVAQDKRIADKAKDALDASNKQSRAALDASIATSRLDQRAWIGMVRVDVVPALPFKADTETTIYTVIGNTGRSPCIRTKMVLHWNLLNPNEPLKAPVQTTPTAISVLFPNSSVVLVTNKVTFPQPMLTAISQGVKVFKIWGEITYDDIFERPHWTHFCTVMRADLNGLDACVEYNQTDEELKKAN